MVLRNLSVIERCPLLGGNLKKIVRMICLLLMACPLFGVSAIGRFHCSGKDRRPICCFSSVEY